MTQDKQHELAREITLQIGGTLKALYNEYAAVNTYDTDNTKHHTAVLLGYKDIKTTLCVSKENDEAQTKVAVTTSFAQQTKTISTLGPSKEMPSTSTSIDDPKLFREDLIRAFAEAHNNQLKQFLSSITTGYSSDAKERKKIENEHIIDAEIFIKEVEELYPNPTA